MVISNWTRKRPRLSYGLRLVNRGGRGHGLAEGEGAAHIGEADANAVALLRVPLARSTK